MKEKRKATILALSGICVYVGLIIVTMIMSKKFIDVTLEAMVPTLEEGVLYALTPDGPIKANTDYKYNPGVVISDTGYTDKMYELFGPEIIYTKEALYAMGDISSSYAVYSAIDAVHFLANAKNSYCATIHKITKENNKYTVFYSVDGEDSSCDVILN